jgi:hypothetical protein
VDPALYVPGVQINLPSLRFNFGFVKVFKYGIGVGATSTTAGVAVDETVKVCEYEPVALVPVTV